jgi:acetyltransferase-like isoleucine patch superfamily enzyme
MKALLHKIAKRVGAAISSRHDSYLMSEQPIYRAHTLGRWSYGKPSILDYGNPGSRLVIGNYCSIANGATILLGGEHRVDTVTTYPFAEIVPEAFGTESISFTRGSVIIGNDVWIGHGATILSGVKLGDGSVVAAGSVVRKDVSPYAIVAGVPADVVRYRFPPEIIAALLRIAWWDWDHKQVIAALPFLTSPDIQAFICEFDPERST